MPNKPVDYSIVLWAIKFLRFSIDVFKEEEKDFVSAGRVQSVALKLVVDREKEIEAFKPVEYWNLGAILKTNR